MMSRRKLSLLFYRLFIFFAMFNLSMENVNVTDYEHSWIHMVFQIMALVTAFICATTKDYSLRSLFMTVIVSAIGLTSYLYGGNSNLFILFIAVALLNGAETVNILRLIFFERLVVFLSVVTASLIGFLPNITMDVPKYTYDSIGYTLGYVHVNSLATQVGGLILLYITLNRKRLTSLRLTVLLVLDIVTYMVARSRTSFGLIFITLLFCLALRIDIVKRVWYSCISWCFPLLTVIVVIFMKLYQVYGWSNSLVVLVNDRLFNGRIGLSIMYLLTYPLTLFGGKLDLSRISMNTYYALDNGYVILLMYYGIIGFGMYWMMAQYVLKRLKQENELLLAFICFICLVWGLYEGMMVSLSGNFSLLFIGIAAQDMIIRTNSQDATIRGINLAEEKLSI